MTGQTCTTREVKARYARAGKRSWQQIDRELDTNGRQIAVFAGFGEEMQPASWEIADTRTYVPWAEKKYDVIVFGMPQFFHYGNGHGTNPILILQAIAANVIRHRRIMSDRAVIICSSTCNGWFHDEVFTGYRELYDVFHPYHCFSMVSCGHIAEDHCAAVY
ncbi:MAG: hypothetical protein ACLFPO_06465, partial [Spirochaetaceae bacterium]